MEGVAAGIEAVIVTDRDFEHGFDHDFDRDYEKWAGVEIAIGTGVEEVAGATAVLVVAWGAYAVVAVAVVVADTGKTLGIAGFEIRPYRVLVRGLVLVVSVHDLALALALALVQIRILYYRLDYLNLARSSSLENLKRFQDFRDSSQDYSMRGYQARGC